MKRIPLGEITVKLRLVFKIPKFGLRINGLIQGMKESSPQIHGVILSTLLEALKERLIEEMLQGNPGRYRRNGRQSRPRHLRCSFGTISYRFAQLVDLQESLTFISFGGGPLDPCLYPLPGGGDGDCHWSFGACLLSQGHS